MANRIWNFLKCLGTNRCDITGSFQPNGSSASVLNVKGNGFNVAHTPGSGVFTVTLQDRYNDFDSVDAWVMGPNVGIQAQITATPDVVNNGTIVITVYDTSTKGAQTDPAFNTNLWICFQLRAKNTSGNW